MSVTAYSARIEPPVYRPFALLAFGATVAGGTPLGIWMLSRLYLGRGQIPADWILLHAHLQIFGFFGTLILGVAHHLVPRFAGRPVVSSRVASWLVGLVGLALVVRAGGTWERSPSWVLVATVLQAATFLLFGAWVWRALDPPHLAILRRHMTASTGWFTLAFLLEAAVRWAVLGQESPVPDPRWMRVVHLMGVFGGVVGWILGVALRAGPMFVPRWHVPDAIARAMPWTLALGILIAATGEVGNWGLWSGTALARLGEAVALGIVGTVSVMAGVFRRRRGALPLLSRSVPEFRFFRLALLSAGVAAPGSVVAGLLAWNGIPPSLLNDALRHLVTVGFLTAMVLAMAFRLIPIFEGVALPWPRLRSVAFWTLLGGVLLRSSEVLADYGWEGILPWLPLSGFLVWVGLACVSANLLGAIRLRTMAARETHLQ